MKYYKLTYFNNYERYDFNIEAKSFTEAENKAESQIEAAFFSDCEDKEYHYTLLCLSTNKKRVVKASNRMAPR